MSINQTLNEIDEMEKDSLRLDWMIANRVCFSTNTSDTYPGDYCMWKISSINNALFILKRTDDPRQAIDSEMEKQEVKL